MIKTRLLLICTSVVAALVLAGCRQEEQGRVLRYDKGSYLGQADTRLSEETLEVLRQRTRNQFGGAGFSSIGGPASLAADVRPPVGLSAPQSDEARAALRTRALRQRAD